MPASVRRTASVRHRRHRPWVSSGPASSTRSSWAVARPGGEELLERVCSDQVRRWRRGERVPAETYLSKYPGLMEDDEAAFELIYGEYLLREEHGEPPSPEELRWRFPKFAERLRRQVEPARGAGCRR